jgi:hypothetical protein
MAVVEFIGWRGLGNQLPLGRASGPGPSPCSPRTSVGRGHTILRVAIRLAILKPTSSSRPATMDVENPPKVTSVTDGLAHFCKSWRCWSG